MAIVQTDKKGIYLDEETAEYLDEKMNIVSQDVYDKAPPVDKVPSVEKKGFSETVRGTQVADAQAKLAMGKFLMDKIAPIGKAIRDDLGPIGGSMLLPGIVAAGASAPVSLPVLAGLGALGAVGGRFGQNLAEDKSSTPTDYAKEAALGAAGELAAPLIRGLAKGATGLMKTIKPKTVKIGSEIVNPELLKPGYSAGRAAKEAEKFRAGTKVSPPDIKGTTDIIEQVIEGGIKGPAGTISPDQLLKLSKGQIANIEKNLTKKGYIFPKDSGKIDAFPLARTRVQEIEEFRELLNAPLRPSLAEELAVQLTGANKGFESFLRLNQPLTRPFVEPALDALGEYSTSKLDSLIDRLSKKDKK